MTTKLSLAALSVVLLAASFSNPARGQWNVAVPGLMTQPEIALIEDSYIHPQWQVEFCSVPELLRMHCPLLRPQQGGLDAEPGVLISRIQRRGPAALVYDLQVGDVLLSAGGEPVFGMASLPDVPGVNLTVMRGGEAISLEARAVCPPDPTRNQARVAPVPVLPPASPYGVSASSFSSGNESVSVAQNGDQITLEMSLPELQSDPIRFRGTRQQIMRDVQNSQLSPAARQRVLQAIR